MNHKFTHSEIRTFLEYDDFNKDLATDIINQLLGEITSWKESLSGINERADQRILELMSSVEKLQRELFLVRDGVVKLVENSNEFVAKKELIKVLYGKDFDS